MSTRQFEGVCWVSSPAHAADLQLSAQIVWHRTNEG